MQGAEDRTSDVTLIMHAGTGVVRSTFEAEAIRIGRSEQNDLVVRDPKASRFHCRIVREGDGVFVEDMGSRNGTRLNGRPILKEPLSHGDMILVGDTEVFYGTVPEKGRETRVDHPDSHDEALLERLLRERSNLMALAEINKALNSEIDLSRLLEIIIDAVIELTDAERGFLITLSDGEMAFEVARNFAESEVEQPELAVSRSIASQVMKDLKPVMSINAREDERFRYVQSITNLGLRSVLCVPLVLRGEGLGAVYVDNRLNKGVFSEEDRSAVEAFADQAAIALENARRMEELKEKNRELERVRKELARANAGLADTVRSQATELKKARARLAGTGLEKGIRYHYGVIVGSSRPMTDLVSLLERVIDSDFPVLIQGESGTGKDLVASAIHFNSRRSAMPYVSESCASLPETLLESELFGHTKGAFTGAVSDRKGLLELAHRGTLFLDEVGDMSIGMQAKLLRFLQDGEFRPVGGAETVRVDVRIISASNRQLLDLVEKGSFRQDLYFRLNVLPLSLPPLRERREDIPQLLKHFLGLLCSELERDVPEISPDVVDAFSRYDWPGNVRELENEMRRLVTLASEAINLDLVSERIRQMPEGGLRLDELEELDLTAKVEAIERHEISEALRVCRSNKSRTARKLGISRFTLQRKIEKYGISVESSE